MKLIKRVEVTIEKEELVGHIVQAIYSDVKEAREQVHTLYRALGGLVGCADVEAVREANCVAREQGWPTITIDEFRKWLPQILSKAFARLLGGEEE